jgi:hypothetical protein
MAGKLTPQGLSRAAALIGTDTRTLRAVLAVEALGDGFLADGRPKILFERHKFYQHADQSKVKQWAIEVPDLCNPKAGGYKGNEAEYPRLYRAMQLDHDGAVLAASWGIGQIMGFNWQMCGERSLMGFVFAMHNNEDTQLMLMAQFIRTRGAADELCRHDWAGFAKLYNGANYAKEGYHLKLAAAYAKAKP